MTDDAHNVSADAVELMLQELDSLPTLSAVAIQLLELTADDDADAQNVVKLVASDPALATKVLALCRCHERGRASDVTTVERAVLLLGFEAVRCAVLSVQVFDLIERLGEAQQRDSTPLFDREVFWLHSLAAAVASEQIAMRGHLTQDVRPSEAFMAGLLHDIGQLVLHVILPESFDQVCRFAETHCASLDRACRQVIGLDTHTVGKRVAEHWRLPATLVDVIWLNGQPTAGLPRIPHRTLISIVTLADALVRSRYVNPGAHWGGGEGINALSIPVGISGADIDAIVADLHDEVTARATALGLSKSHGPKVLLRAISRANESLARANAGMRQREQLSQRRARVLRELRRFHESIPPRANTVETANQVAMSASVLFDKPVEVVLVNGGDDIGWRLIRRTPDGRVIDLRNVSAPADAIPLKSLLRDVREAAEAAAMLPWLRNELSETVAFDDLHLFPLGTGEAGSAILLIKGEPEATGDAQAISALSAVWRSALLAGSQHDQSQQLTEQLAEANRTLVETQEALARSRTLGAIGEVAAGAAHEMNNPLTIISGRSQLLAASLRDPDHCAMAKEIAVQSHRLSDMITALRSFAEPVEVTRTSVDLAELVFRVVQRHALDARQPQINTILMAKVLPASVDSRLLGDALDELLTNAIESKGSRHIELRVQTDPLDDRLRIEVRDDGEGMNDHTLRHAFDPFFSARPAGRQPGLGLARARRYVEALGGNITLANGPQEGAVATIWLNDWRDDGVAPLEREAA